MTAPEGAGAGATAAAVVDEGVRQAPAATSDPSAPGLYIHIPFCRHRCPYCDFNVYPLDEVEDDAETDGDGPGRETAERRRIGPYLDLLDRELALRRRRGLDRIRTLHVGGGTPSLLSPSEIERLFAAVRRRCTLEPGAEIGFEANPGTLDDDKLSALKRAGVNRLSLGLQAWQDHHLKRLGRLHDRHEFIEDFRAARRHGFASLNVDVLFGLPGQTAAEWRRTLERVLQLAPEHLSTYGLQIEAGTDFGRWHRRGLLQRPTEEAERQMLQWARRELRRRGFIHYELANFARPGHASRHNRLYWLNRDYLGAGAGAHSHLQGRRFWNLRGPGAYAEALEADTLPLAGEEQSSRRRQMAETMLMGLRLVREGVAVDRFRRRFGADPRQVFAAELEQLAAADLIEISGERIRLSREALPVANKVFRAFVCRGDRAASS